MRRFAPSSPTSLYVYARETVGYALVIGGRVHCPASGPGTIAALAGPLRAARRHRAAGVHGQRRGGAGRGAPAADPARRPRRPSRNGSATAITDLLRVARAGNQQAKELLAERARVLGEAVALLRDLLNPDELVVGGQAFTEYPEAMEQVEAAFAERSVLAPRDIRVTAFGNRVQEAGAGIVSLGGLYADPLGAMRRAGALDSRLREVAPSRPPDANNAAARTGLAAGPVL